MRLSTNYHPRATIETAPQTLKPLSNKNSFISCAQSHIIEEMKESEHADAFWICDEKKLSESKVSLCIRVFTLRNKSGSKVEL